MSKAKMIPYVAQAKYSNYSKKNEQILLFFLAYFTP
jgi:hypothetical protein